MARRRGGRNFRSAQNRTAEVWANRPVCFRGRSSDSVGPTLLAGRANALRHQYHLGFRTCLPLRGSSGFSPDSLLILLVEKQLYLG
jgi:hypothetical protein